MANKPLKLTINAAITLPLSPLLPANMAATEPADFHQPQVQNIYGYYFQFWVRSGQEHMDRTKYAIDLT
jgi:hypothetical protein